MSKQIQIRNVPDAQIMNCHIRDCQLSDAPTVASLSQQLGYAVSVEEMEDRLEHMSKNANHAILVACLAGGAVVGWIDVGIVFHLQSGSYCEIGGLVVTDAVRGQGIGRELVAASEQWAAARGMNKVVVRSNAIRADAHRFYLRENYTMVKTSAVFEKRL